MGKIYKDYFNYYLDRSTWENIEISIPKIAKNVEYYKDDKAFYKYIPKDKNLLYQALLRTRTTGLPELLWYELRIYTAEHPGPSISGLPELIGLDGFKHVSVVAGVWLYQKRTVTIYGKTYTRYEENFSHWLIGNGCAGTYKEHDDLILKQVKIFYDYEDLRKEAFGVMPADGKYYPMYACAYSVGTFFLDWVCQNNANAFTFCKWGICVVPPNYAGVEIYGTFGKKMYSRRKCADSLWQVKKGGVPGNRLYYNQFPLANLYISQIFEASAHGEGFGLYVYYNRKKNDWRKTEAKYRSKDIPFNGPSRSVMVEECRTFVITDQAEGLGLFDQECKDKKGKGYPVIDKQMLYEGNQTCKAIDMCGIQAHAGYYMIGSGDAEFEFDIDEYPILYLTMKAEKDTDTCLLLVVHDKEPRDYVRRFVAIGKTREGYRSCVSVGLGGKDCFTIGDDNKWHDYIYDLRKLREKYPDAKTVRMVQFYSGKLCNGISHTVHFSSLIFKSRK